MARERTAECPQCGAPVTLPRGTAVVVCANCHARLHRKGSRHEILYLAAVVVAEAFYPKYRPIVDMTAGFAAAGLAWYSGHPLELVTEPGDRGGSKVGGMPALAKGPPCPACGAPLPRRTLDACPECGARLRPRAPMSIATWTVALLIAYGISVALGFHGMRQAFAIAIGEVLLVAALQIVAPRWVPVEYETVTE